MTEDGRQEPPSRASRAGPRDPSIKEPEVPELPEVETVRRGLEPAMVGARFVNGRAAAPGPALSVSATRFRSASRGGDIVALGRRAKYLLADLDDGDVLVMHLGMSGSFRVEGDAAAQPAAHGAAKNPAHDHVVFALSNGARIVYNDPRRFGFMLLVPARRAGRASPVQIAWA